MSFDEDEWLGVTITLSGVDYTLPAGLQRILKKAYEEDVWTVDDVPEDGTSLGQAELKAALALFNGAIADGARLLKLIALDTHKIRFERWFTAQYAQAVDDALDEETTREKVQFLCEAVGGCRIGEVCGGGDSHGILANNLKFLADENATEGELGSRGVELKLEHSKTGFARYLNMASITQTTGIEVEEVFKDYCKEAGFKMRTATQAGVKVVSPDFWVVRVSLLGLEEKGVNRLLKRLEGVKSKEVQSQLASTKIATRTRYIASGASSQEKKYVNVAAGDSENRNLDDLVELLQQAGYTAQKVPGPLLLATTGGRSQTPKIMPYSTSTASAPTKELLTNAWRAGLVDGVSTDADLDLPPGQEPKWSTHSLRRLADTVARRYREASGTTEDQIDIYFGWHEKILLKAMQVHYASLSIRERMMLSKITGML